MIAEQKLIARNAENSIEVRQAAIDKIVELEKSKLTETLDLQNTELTEELRASAIRTGISAKDEESIKRRSALIKEWALSFGTASGTQAINAELQQAEELETRLNKLIIEGINDRGQRVQDTRAYRKALEELTPEENRLLELRKINGIITDEERNKINKLVETQAGSITEAINSEVALQRLRNQLRAELLGEEEKKAKADKEHTKSTVEENLASLDKFVDEANKKIYDIELGFGGMQTLEEYEKQIEDNLKGFEDIMSENPMFSDENGAQAKAYDEAQKQMADNLAEFERLQQEAWEKMQAFAEEHPIASALGFESEEQLNQIKEYADQIMSFINDLVNQQVEARTRLVDDWNQKIDEQQELVNRENEDRAQGLANNYEIEQQNLVKMQKARDQAIKDREKSIKLQRTLSTIESSISLISAAANIMKGFSSIPVVGVILGLAAVAAMIAGFVAAQSKVKDATQLAEGGLLTGKKHSEGGIRIPGTNIEVEGEEFVTNRKSTAKYLPLLEAINKDDRDGMRLFFDRKFINKMPPQKGFDIDKSKRLSEIARNTRKNNSETIYGPGYIIERIGGYTKKINLN